MLKFSADLKVNRPVEQVFARLTHADNQGKFDKSSLKMELSRTGSVLGYLSLKGLAHACIGQGN